MHLLLRVLVLMFFFLGSNLYRGDLLPESDTAGQSKIDSFILDTCYGPLTEDSLPTGNWFCCNLYGGDICDLIKYRNGKIIDNIEIYSIKKDGSKTLIGVKGVYEGELNGPTIIYKEGSRQVRQIRIYKDGVVDSRIDFHDNGMIKSFGDFNADTVLVTPVMYNIETDSFEPMDVEQRVVNAGSGRWYYYNEDGKVDSVKHY